MSLLQHQDARCCKVPGCTANLADEQDYSWKHRVCKLHRDATYVLLDGVPSRWCQRCTRFEAATRFAGDKRSCEKLLEALKRKRARARAAARHDATDSGDDAPYVPSKVGSLPKHNPRNPRTAQVHNTISSADSAPTDDNVVLATDDNAVPATDDNAVMAIDAPPDAHPQPLVAPMLELDSNNNANIDAPALAAQLLALPADPSDTTQLLNWLLHMRNNSHLAVITAAVVIQAQAEQGLQHLPVNAGSAAASDDETATTQIELSHAQGPTILRAQ